MSAPTLSHDIEEWIKDHSHAAIYASLGRMYATHQLLEDRVTSWSNEHTDLRARVARLEDAIAEMSGECPYMEPRGPHD